MCRFARLAAVAPIAVAVCGLLAAAEPALAQSVSLDLGGDGPTVTGRIVQLLALITVISLAPSILVMVTSFASSSCLPSSAPRSVRRRRRPTRCSSASPCS